MTQLDAAIHHGRMQQTKQKHQHSLKTWSVIAQGTGVTAAETFSEWKAVVHSEKNTRHFIHNNHAEKFASLQLSAKDRFSGGDEEIFIHVGCRKLPKMNLLGSVDCFLVFEVMDPVKRTWQTIHKTQVVKNDSNPDFKQFMTTAQENMYGNVHTPIRISAYNCDGYSSPKLIGRLKTTVEYLEMLSRLKKTIPFRDHRYPKKHRGELQALPHGSFTKFSSVHRQLEFTFKVSVVTWATGDAITMHETTEKERRTAQDLHMAEMRNPLHAQNPWP